MAAAEPTNVLQVSKGSVKHHWQISPRVEIDSLLFGCEYMTQGKRTLTGSWMLALAEHVKILPVTP